MNPKIARACIASCVLFMASGAVAQPISGPVVQPLSAGSNISISNSVVSNTAPIQATADVTAAGFLLSTTAASTYSTVAQTVDLQRVLTSKRSANMAITTDQNMTIVSGVTKYTVDRVIATNCSATPVLAAGGLYTAASKGGSAIVAAGQAYTALTSPGAFLPMTLAITTSTFTATTLFFSLTVANGTALTCDIYVIGTDLT